MAVQDIKDPDGRPYGAELCKAGTTPGGGWVEYRRVPLSGPEALRKLSYVQAVEGRPWVVGAGVNEPSASIEELQRVSAGLN
jgi:signal transduction histidine kinase